MAVTKGSDSSLLLLHINPRTKTCDVAIQTELVPVTVGVQTIERSSTANSVEISNSESSSVSEEGESDAGDDLNEQFKDTRTVLNKSIETEKKIREKKPSTSHRKNKVTVTRKKSIS
ncbi:hypothetical protein K501DRAFT_277053 [Backusella circina FSU 941]|nr:hypothetical protein K501DRAFT_277053 [Backusella circina FSU 941]